MTWTTLRRRFSAVRKITVMQQPAWTALTSAVMAGAAGDAAAVAQGRGVRAAGLNAIKQDIARNLNRPDLSVAGLGGRHGCTQRLVQRLFESEGTTFTAHVLGQRLARAHASLAGPGRKGEKVSTVASMADSAMSLLQPSLPQALRQRAVGRAR